MASTEPTEIRCQETAKGGVSYQVILAEPAVQTPPKRAASPTRTNKNLKPLEEKLKAAEERRMSIEANKMAQLAAQLEKIEMAAKKRDEHTNAFIAQTKEALGQRMESHGEKREAHISLLKAKVKDHLERGEKSRQSLDQQATESLQAVEENLKRAAEARDENLKKMLERLHERGEQVQKVMNNRHERVQALEAQIQAKLDQASERREKMQQEEKDKLRTHNTTKIAEVRQTIELKESAEEKVKAVQTKLVIAEQNREKEIQKKLENIRKNERRAEVVRQNKERLSMQGSDQQTASSG